MYLQILLLIIIPGIAQLKNYKATSDPKCLLLKTEMKNKNIICVNCIMSLRSIFRLYINKKEKKTICFVTIKTINKFICLINMKEKSAIQFQTACETLFFSIFIPFLTSKVGKLYQNCQIILDSFFLKHFDKTKQASMWGKIKHSLFSSFFKMQILCEGTRFSTKKSRWQTQKERNNKEILRYLNIYL